MRKVSDAIVSSKPDVDALRQSLARRADESLAAVKGGGNDAWLSEADATTIAFSPVTADNHSILINGKSTTFWPRDTAAAAISNF